MFEKIRLLTRDGGFVHEAEVPRFTPPAEVLVWGARVFVRRENGEYREGMAFYVLPDAAIQDARRTVQPIIDQEVASETVGPDTLDFTMR